MSVVKIWAWCVTRENYRYKKMSLLLLTTVRSAKRSSLTNRWKWKMKRILENSFFIIQYGRILWVKIIMFLAILSPLFIDLPSKWRVLEASWDVPANRKSPRSPRLNSIFLSITNILTYESKAKNDIINPNLSSSRLNKTLSIFYNCTSCKA